MDPVLARRVWSIRQLRKRLDLDDGGNPGSGASGVSPPPLLSSPTVIPLLAGGFNVGAVAVAFTPDGTKAYAATNSGRPTTVQPITVATSTPTAPIMTAAFPHFLAVSPDGAKAYAALHNGTVAVIDVATDTVTGTIAVGRLPTAVAFTPDGVKAYVVNQHDNTVTPITVASDTPGVAIAVGTTPAGVAFTPDGVKAYVANQTDGTVTPITVATSTPGAPITVGAGPALLAISPDGTKVYVPNDFDGTVSVIDPATDTVTATMTVGSNPTAVAFAPDGVTAYVVNGSDGTVSVIDVATHTVLAIVEVAAGALTHAVPTTNAGIGDANGIAISPDGAKAYVATDAAMQVFDLLGASPSAAWLIGTKPPAASLLATSPPAPLPTSPVLGAPIYWSQATDAGSGGWVQNATMTAVIDYHSSTDAGDIITAPPRQFLVANWISPQPALNSAPPFAYTDHLPAGGHVGPSLTVGATADQEANGAQAFNIQLGAGDVGFHFSGVFGVIRRDGSASCLVPCQVSQPTLTSAYDGTNYNMDSTLLDWAGATVTGTDLSADATNHWIHSTAGGDVDIFCIFSIQAVGDDFPAFA